jgi:hypothetical protein
MIIAIGSSIEDETDTILIVSLSKVDLDVLASPNSNRIAFVDKHEHEGMAHNLLVMYHDTEEEAEAALAARMQRRH